MLPSTPQKPCTEMAPQGSSILVTLSLNRTPRQTTRPARTPMMNAEVGPTNAQGAVMATRPASMPLHAMVISGLPNFQYQKSIAVAEPEIAARLVLIAIRPDCGPEKRAVCHLVRTCQGEVPILPRAPWRRNRPRHAPR